VKYRMWLQLAVIALFIFALVNLLRSCQSDPTQIQLFDHLAIMRNDMQAVIHDGGQVVRYDNNGKTTFARVYLLLSIDRQTWTIDLERTYINTLLARGWTQVKGANSERSFCKNGAFASITAPADIRNGSVGMTFDAASISKCEKASVANDVSGSVQPATAFLRIRNGEEE
jgi:hypothetical protein